MKDLKIMEEKDHFNPINLFMTLLFFIFIFYYYATKDLSLIMQEGETLYLVSAISLAGKVPITGTNHDSNDVNIT